MGTLMVYLEMGRIMGTLGLGLCARSVDGKIGFYYLMVD